VRRTRTTTCCSAIALIAVAAIALDAQKAAPRPRRSIIPRVFAGRPAPTTLSLFPIQGVWTLALESPLAAPPAYDETHAFFALGDRLLAYRLDDGRQEWNASAKPIVEPVAGDGLLFIREAAQLQALRVDDATVAWQRPFTDDISVHPAWGPGCLVVATAGGAVLMFRASDGLPLWRHELKSAAHAPATVSENRVYIPTVDGRIVALDAGSGEQIWEHRLGGPVNDVLATADRVFAGSNDHFFYSLLAPDGRIDWRWRTGGDVIGKPAIDGDRVYFVSRDNVLRAHDPATGVQQWQRPLPLRPTSGPVLVGSSVVVTGLSPTIRGFNAIDGTPGGDQSTTGEIAAPVHALGAAAGPFPRILVLTRDLAKGASALLFMRSGEPGARPFAALPNPVTTLPKLPVSGEMLDR
jgi:hypothetical protein